MMTRPTLLLAVLLTLLAQVVQAACTGRDVWPHLNPAIKAKLDKAAARDAFSDGRFFRVSKNGKTSYVFGTMHSPPTGKLRLPPPVTKQLRQSKTLLVEVTDEAETAFFGNMNRVASQVYAQSPTGFARQFSQDEWKIINLMAKANGLDQFALSHARPWYVYLLASSIGCGGTPGQQQIMDARLEQIAKNSGMQITGLETPLQAFEAMQGFSARDYAKMIRAEMHAFVQGQPGDMYYTSLNMYYRGEIQKIWYWQMQQYTGAPDKRGAALIRRLWEEKMLGRRNKNWIPKITKAFAQGDAFVAVGALHLGGKQGILPLLRRKGYDIVRIKFIYR